MASGCKSCSSSYRYNSEAFIPSSFPSSSVASLLPSLSPAVPSPMYSPAVPSPMYSSAVPSPMYSPAVPSPMYSFTPPLSSIYRSLPFDAKGITELGYVQTSRDIARHRWDAKSYYNFLQAQSLPYEFDFSGSRQVCADCLPNDYAINIQSVSPSNGIPPDYQPLLISNRPIASADSALLPAYLPRYDQSYAAYRGCTSSRIPFIRY